MSHNEKQDRNANVRFRAPAAVTKDELVDTQLKESWRQFKISLKSALAKSVVNTRRLDCSLHNVETCGWQPGLYNTVRFFVLCKHMLCLQNALEMSIAHIIKRYENFRRCFNLGFFYSKLTMNRHAY